MSKFRRRPKANSPASVRSSCEYAALMAEFFALPKSRETSPQQGPAAPTVSHLPSNKTNSERRFKFFTPACQSQMQATVEAVAKSANLQTSFGNQRTMRAVRARTCGRAPILNFIRGSTTSVAGSVFPRTIFCLHASIYVSKQCFGAKECMLW